MFKLAWKSLWQEKAKLAMSVGGIAAAVLLIIVMNGVFAGAARQATAYIDTNQADIFVMQKGVSNMHMASSVLPSDLAGELRAVKGVERVIGITFASTSIKHAEHKIFSYVIGYDPSAPFGGPWKMAQGTTKIGADEAVVDATFARNNGFGVGDRIEIMNRRFRIAGLSDETFGLASNIAFVRDTSLAEINLAPGITNYYLVEVEEDETPAAVTRRIKNTVPRVNALTRGAFSGSDQRMILQMGIDIIGAMSFLSFLIGAVIVALTTYTATLARIRDFGILKAMGAAMRKSYLVVLGQAVSSAVLGYVIGLVLSLVTVLVVPEVSPGLTLLVEPATLLRVFAIITVISVVASVAPVRRISRVDPLLVFKA